MKKIFLIAALIVALYLPASAADVVQKPFGSTYYSQLSSSLYLAEFTITADGGGGVDITSFLRPSDIQGLYLFSMEMYSATDAAFTVTLSTGATATGTPVHAYTTTTATVGEIDDPDFAWPVYGTWRIDVTGLTATESCTVKVTFLRVE